MNDHNLDDLIIDNIEPKNSKTKSFLTIIALLIVVLIVAIILTKIILKDPNADRLALEEHNTELISPELTLQSVTDTQAHKKEPKAPEPAPKAKPQPVEEVAQPTVKITNEFSQEPTVDAEAKAKKEAQRIAEVKKAEAEAKRKEELAAKRLAEEKAKKEAAQREKAQIEKAKKEAAQKQAAATLGSDAYYIQVGSFTQTPSAKFLSVISNSGFTYKITPPSDTGTKKLLIGPYKDKQSAYNALVRVKDRINKSAFVIKK